MGERRPVSLERRRVREATRSVLCLIAFLLLPTGIRASSLEELPLDHWAYPLIDNLQKRGHFGDLYLANRPYTQREVAAYCIDLMDERDSGVLNRVEASWVERLEREFTGEIALLQGRGEGSGKDFNGRILASGMARADLKEDDKELEPPYESIKFSGAVDPDYAVRFGIGGSLQYKDRLVFVDRLRIDSDPINEPAFRLRGRGIMTEHLDIPGAYFGGRYGPISFLSGRTNLVWGYGNSGAMTVSGVSPPFDLVKYHADVWNFRASGFLAFLDKMPQEGTMINRFLYGHRLDWRATRWLQLGFSETAVVTGEGRSIELSYLNPFLPYLLIQKEEEGNQVNTDAYSSVDGAVFLRDGFFFSGELLIDDTFFFRNEGNKDFPFQTAIDLETDWSGQPLPPWMMLTASYTRIGSFVYLHRGTATYYSHYDAPIGHVLGPDTDLWKIGVSARLNDAIEVVVDYRQRRRGENRLEPGISARGHRGDPFPTGVVESRKGIGLGLSWFATDDIHLRSDFVYTSVRDLNNEAGRDDSIADLELSLVYRFAYGSTFGGS